MSKTFTVEANWDAEAGVWYSSSDVPGLVIETETLEEFEQTMKELAPEMLAANLGLHNVRVPVELVVKTRHELAVA